jgi:hypothetical protein
MFFLGGNNFYAQQAQWRLKVTLFKVGLAVLAGVLLWVWVTFNVHIPTPKPQPAPSPTSTSQEAPRGR